MTDQDDDIVFGTFDQIFGEEEPPTQEELEFTRKVNEHVQAEINKQSQERGLSRAALELQVGFLLAQSRIQSAMGGSAPSYLQGVTMGLCDGLGYPSDDARWAIVEILNTLLTATSENGSLDRRPDMSEQPALTAGLWETGSMTDAAS